MQKEASPAFGGTERYRIERELGHGGMGVVYEALDTERNTRVALKALTKRDALNIYRLKNEFRQLADLSHPNLVSLHELCNDGDSWFFTMELVQGKTFDEYIADDQPSSFPPPVANSRRARIRIVREASVTLSQQAIGSEYPMPRVTCHVGRLRQTLRQLVEAIAALHGAGKLHRDLKPSNVLVAPDGRVVVLDFGLVSNTTFVDPESLDAERTVGGCVFGTPAYMSPEQAVGEPVTPASDWYAVGSMLYEALTGQLPFDGSVLEILKQKEDLEPIPPSDVVKGVPDDLDYICRELLRRDPSRRPTGPKILRMLTGHTNPPPIFDAQSTPAPRDAGELFVGREAHLDELRSAFEHTREGHPVTVFVHGLSGMGKTALVRCFANELIRREEAVVLRGRCYERETVPYKAFDNIIDSLSRYLMRLPREQAAELLPRNVHSLARLFPVLKRVQVISSARRPKHQTDDAREVRNQAFGALKDLLLRITDFQPLVLNIDDLQWADMDSARLLAFLLSPPEPPPLLLVGAYRRDEAATSPFLRHILGDGGLDRAAIEVRDLAVDRLSHSESQLLAEQLLRHLPTANALFSQAIADESEGVPFFITELVQHVKSRAEHGIAFAQMDTISLDGVIACRIDGMAEPARNLLSVLAVAAGPIEQGIAIEAAELPPGDRAALLALRAARLIRTRGTRQTDTAETYHDRVRESVVAHLSAAERQAIHRRLAIAIETWAPGDPERLVDHYAGAGDGVRAGETAIEAAHAADDQLAFDRAAELYRKAIELRPASDAKLEQLYHQYGEALANAGRGAAAAEAYLQAARRSERSLEFRRRAAQQLLRSGRTEDGMALANELLRGVGIRTPRSTPGAITALLWNRLRLAMRGHDFEERTAEEMTERQRERLATTGMMFQEVAVVEPLQGALLQSHFLLEALSAGDATCVARGLAWAAFNAALGGTAGDQKVRELLARADALAARLDTPYARAVADLGKAGSMLFLGRYLEVREPALRAEQTFKDSCAGSSWEANVATVCRYAAIQQVGGLPEIRHEAPARIREAREKDDGFAAGFLALSIPLVHLMADDPEAAMTLLNERRAALRGGFSNYHLWVMQKTVDTFIYEGDGEQALRHIDGHWPAFSSTYTARTAFFKLSGYSYHSRAALAAFMTSRNPAHLDRAEDDLRVMDAITRPDAKALATSARAAVLHQRGDRAHAESLLRKAAELFEQACMPLYATYARRNLAALMEDRDAASRADSELRSQGIARPAAWTATFAPGFLSPQA